MVWVLVQLSRSWARPGPFKLTCLAGALSRRRDSRGGLAGWAGAEDVMLQARGAGRPVAAVAAGIRRSEWSRRAPLGVTFHPRPAVSDGGTRRKPWRRRRLLRARRARTQAQALRRTGIGTRTGTVRGGGCVFSRAICWAGPRTV